MQSGNRLGTGPPSRRRIALLALVVLVFTGFIVPAGASTNVVPAVQLPPIPVEGLFTGSPPEVTAQAWILYDATFDRVLAEHEADQRRAIASTTKMMTALVADQNAWGFEQVTISEVAPEVGEAEIDLVAGEVWSVDDLLYAMLLRSANDAAVAVAEHVGGTVEGFVELMNEKAIELGMQDSRFVNPHGLDEEGHYGSARDLLTLAQAMMAEDKLALIAGTPRAKLPPTAEGEERPIESTNRLLFDYLGANGVKTGFTDDAGWSLVASAERGGRLLYVVVLGSETLEDRFADATAMLDYGFGQFGVVEVIVAGVDYARRRLPDESEDAVAAETFSIFANREDADLIELTPAFTEDEAVVIASIGDEELARVPLVPAPAPNLPELSDAVGWAGRYWDWLFGNA